MAHGLQIFNPDGSILLDSSKQLALHHSSAYHAGGGDAVFALPTGLSNSGFSVWPDNGHVVGESLIRTMYAVGNGGGLLGSFLGLDGYTYYTVDTWDQQLGPNKPIAYLEGGTLVLRYPTFFYDNLYGYTEWQGVRSSGSSNIDFWAN